MRIVSPTDRDAARKAELEAPVGLEDSIRVLERWDVMHREAHSGHIDRDRNEMPVDGGNHPVVRQGACAHLRTPPSA